MAYFWIRVYDYSGERDGYEKGTKLDEFYIKDAETREEAKEQVKALYPRTNLNFAKPKKGKNGIYALVLDSNQFFYDRFNTEVDTLCFWCHTPIKGKASEFPRAHIGKGIGYKPGENEFASKDTAYFCIGDHKRAFHNAVRKDGEGEFQEKEAGMDGTVFGYIYLIYNRATNIYYVGQTRYMPFFRWQEHIKSGEKGDISDLTFSVLAEIRNNSSVSEDENQDYLNSMEAWWIAKYQEEGYEVLNVTKPKITLRYLKERFDEMIAKQAQMQLLL